MFYEDSSFQEIAILAQNESMLFSEPSNRIQPPYASVCFVEQNQYGRPVTFAKAGIDTPAHLCLSCRLVPCQLHRDQKSRPPAFQETATPSRRAKPVKLARRFPHEFFHNTFTNDPASLPSRISNDVLFVWIADSLVRLQDASKAMVVRTKTWADR